LTTPAPLHRKKRKGAYKKLYKLGISSNFEDSHNRLETPGLIPNPEVKLPMLLAVVAHKLQTLQAVFFLIFLKILNSNKL
jgi:hypothetical protein